MSDNNSYPPEGLLQTKLFRPALRPDLVKRPHLIRRLNDGLGRNRQGFATRLSLISAPAGFGKTTLVAAWLAGVVESDAIQLGGRVAWLSLDENDNDPVQFLSYLIAALQTVLPGVGAAAERLFRSPQPPAPDAVLMLILNDVMAGGRRVVLAIDDYHTITSPPVHQCLTYLVEHLPPMLHVLVISRSDPPLPLSRLRARGQLLEIRADDLRFSLAESRLFFSQMMGLALEQEELVALEEHTEGWIAGLQLAALSMQGRDDVAEFIANFSGSNRYILDYLTDEVLERRPKGTKNFLLQTSILDRLCGPLCEAVTGQTGGQATLQHLEDANLFLIPLDDERLWYRYHHLFAEVLRRRLSQEQRASLPVLHERARTWFEQNGLMHEAVNHALAGQDYEAAADLLERVAETMLHSGASASLVRWLDAVPEETIVARPRLSLARAWTFQWGSALSLERAAYWAERALEAAEVGGAVDPNIAGEAAALQSMIAATRGEMARSRERANMALDNLPSDSRWRSAILFSLGTTYFYSGDMIAATGYLDEALKLSEADGVHYIQLAAAGFLADMQVYQGHLSRAAAMYEQILEWSFPSTPQKGNVMAHGGLAGIHYERNQLEDALIHVQLGEANLDEVGGAWAMHVLYRVQARIYQVRGQHAEAVELMTRVCELGQRAQVSLVATQAAALRAELQLAQGNIDAVQKWAEASGLAASDEEAGHPGWREAEYVTLARVLSARGEDSEALFLLERLLSAADEEGRLGSEVGIYVLMALINQKQGAQGRAIDCLRQALAFGEAEGYCRVFVDEGRPMVELLQLIRRRDYLSSYVDTLLNALAMQDILHSSFGVLPDPLSDRELEVLRLVAAGATNKDIAGALVLAVPTVKKHLSNIMSKLDVANRTEAATKARTLGLL